LHAERSVRLERVDLEEAAAGAGRRAADDRERRLAVRAVVRDERAAVATVLADADLRRADDGERLRVDDRRDVDGLAAGVTGLAVALVSRGVAHAVRERQLVVVEDADVR